jgi:hypothetical protein
VTGCVLALVVIADYKANSSDITSVRSCTLVLKSAEALLQTPECSSSLYLSAKKR